MAPSRSLPPNSQRNIVKMSNNGYWRNFVAQSPSITVRFTIAIVNNSQIRFDNNDTYHEKKL